jgi:hypothetical protein
MTIIMKCHLQRMNNIFLQYVHFFEDLTLKNMCSRKVHNSLEKTIKTAAQRFTNKKSVYFNSCYAFSNLLYYFLSSKSHVRFSTSHDHIIYLLKEIQKYNATPLIDILHSKGK